MVETLKDKASKAAQNDESVPRFLRTVFQILEEQSHSDYICWSQDGRAVMIKNPTTFAQDLLPVYFKHSNYTSFVRQLNLYAFRKQKNYPYDNAFAHSMFIRGRKDLLKFIKRKGYGETKQIESQAASSELSEEEPRFDEVIEQNRCFKQVNRDISDKLKYFEEQVNDISNKNDQLQKQIQKKEQTEVFLKRLITKMSKVYGFDNIKTLIESVRAEMQKEGKENTESVPVLREEESINVKEDMNFYENLFSRKVSTASTVADMSELTLYPFQGSHSASDQTNLWPDEANKLSFLPKRVDSDFGISSLHSVNHSSFFNKDMSCFNFN